MKEERKKFTLYYGIDVGSQDPKNVDKEAGKNNLAYLDANALPMQNGVNGAPRVQNDYSGEPEYAEYGYAGTIQHPVKPSKKKKSKYRQSHEY